MKEKFIDFTEEEEDQIYRNIGRGHTLFDKLVKEIEKDTTTYAIDVACDVFLRLVDYAIAGGCPRKNIIDCVTHNTSPEVRAAKHATPSADDFFDNLWQCEGGN
jgi:hypothetical protein